MRRLSQESPKDADASRVRGFDGLRALAALLVFVEHKVRDLGTGAVGVWVFFALSGYLIVGILQRARASLETGAGGSRALSLAKFWQNRALRILPVYYLSVLLVFALGIGDDPRAFPYYLLHVQNFYIACVSGTWSHITHLWSLAIEQQFYALAAPVLLCVAARAHGRVLAALLGACVVSTLAAGLLGWNPFAVALLPPANFAFIALGGLLYLERDGGLGRALGSGVFLLAAGVVFTAVFVATRGAYHPMGGTPLSVYLSGLVLAGSIIGFTAKNQTGALVRLLHLRPLRWLGTISYGFYVYHPLVPGREHAAALLSADALLAVPRPLWLLVELGVALGLAHVSFYLFERRFLRRKA